MKLSRNVKNVGSTPDLKKPVWVCANIRRSNAVKSSKALLSVEAKKMELANSVLRSLKQQIYSEQHKNAANQKYVTTSTPYPQKLPLGHPRARTAFSKVAPQSANYSPSPYETTHGTTRTVFSKTQNSSPQKLEPSNFTDNVVIFEAANNYRTQSSFGATLKKQANLTVGGTRKCKTPLPSSDKSTCNTKYKKMLKRERLFKVLMSKITWKEEIARKRFVLQHPVVKLLEKHARNTQFNCTLYGKKGTEKVQKYKEDIQSTKIGEIMNSRAAGFIRMRKCWSITNKSPYSII